MQNLNIEGAKFEYAKFNPRSIPGKAEKPKFENKRCFGQKIEVSDRNKYRSLDVAIQSMYITFGLYTDHFRYKRGRLNKLFGSNQLFKLLNGKLKDNNGKLIKSPPGLFKLLDEDKKKFTIQAANYHLY